MSKPKEKSIVQIPSLIANSAVEGDSPFVDFQTNPPETDTATRHYFESIPITLGANRNSFDVTEKAMKMVAKGYKEGRPLTINHDKGNWTNTLGYGATVDAVVKDGKLYVASYVALNKTYPQGPFGTSEELRDGIIDGFVNSVSQSIMPLKAKCSVDGLPYPMSYAEYDMEGYCRHFRGQTVVVVEDDVKRIETVIIIIEEAEATELSLVMIPADEGSGIVRPKINFSIDDFIDEQRMEFLSEGADDKISAPKPINPGVGDPPPNPEEGVTPVSITQEQLTAMETRAVTAETEKTTLTVGLNASKADVVRLEGETKTADAEKRTVEAEKAALQAQLDASESKVALLEAADKLQKDESAKKDTRIQTLESTAQENEIVIKDGKEAREAIVEEYATAFAKAVGTDCTEAMKDQQREVAKSFDISILTKKIEGFEEAAKVNFPPGKVVTKAAASAGTGEGGGNGGTGYPTGV